MIDISAGRLTGLLKNKKRNEDEKDKIIIASAALDLIGYAISKENSQHKLSEEMDNLGKYVAAIENAISMEKK